MRVIAAPAPAEAAAASRPTVAAVMLPWSVGLAAAVVFFTLALIRYLSFHSTAYDLGFFDQVLWNVAQGRGLASTFIAYNFFGEHFEPALLLFVPLYRLAPSPVWLLAAQSVALGLAVVPVHALAGRLLGALPSAPSPLGRGIKGGGLSTIAPAAAWFAVAAYLFQLGLARAVEFDFHTEALAVPFVFLAIMAAMSRRWPLFLVCAAAPLLAKEDGALVVVSIGVLAFLLTRHAISLAPVAGGVAYGVVVVGWIMPVVRAGAPGDLVLRYAYLGTTPNDVALHIFTKPTAWIGHFFGSPAPLAVLVMVAAVGMLPLLRPAALGIAVAPLIPSVISMSPYQAGLRLQYALGAVPLLVLAAVLGWQRVPRIAGGVALLAGALATWIWLGPILPSLGTDVPQLSRAGAIDSVLARIPREARVAASSGLVPHLSERREIWEFPAGLGVPWVVVDNVRQPTQESLASGYREAIARLPLSGYRLAAESGGVSLWRLEP